MNMKSIDYRFLMINKKILKISKNVSCNKKSLPKCVIVSMTIKNITRKFLKSLSHR